MRFLSLPLLLSISFLASAGCTESREPATSVTVETPAAVLTSVNTHCPVMGSEVAPDGGSVEFEGKTVGFCCPGCIDEWNKFSDEEKTAKLASAGKDNGDTHDHGEHEEHGEDNDTEAG